MKTIDCQQEYWDRVAHEKNFTHSIDIDKLSDLVPKQSRILDYGCGYGRTCAELADYGYTDIIGVDISSEMINRGKSLNKRLNIQYFNGDKLPFENNTFKACSLLAVLTCIPTNQGQTHVIDEIKRVLNKEGILYLSDFPLQKDNRNIQRYSEFQSEFDEFGVFRLPDGGIVRHHEPAWIHELLSGFTIISDNTMEVSTMNGNKAEIFQIIAKKKSK